MMTTASSLFYPSQTSATSSTAPQPNVDFSSSSEARKHSRPLGNHPLQGFRIQAQRLQDRRRDLLRADLLRELGRLQTWAAGNARHLAVVVAQPTVLGRLGVARRVARAQVRADDDVRHGRVGGRIAEPLRDQGGAGDRLVDLERGFVGVQVRDRGGGVGGVV